MVRPSPQGIKLAAVGNAHGKWWRSESDPVRVKHQTDQLS
jgi:hypothetical protein